MNKYKSNTLGVFVLTLEDYLKKFWPNLTEATDLYESLSASLKESCGRKGIFPKR